MVTVISRFRVANGMQEEVRQAFLQRPRLVEKEPGFRAIEILCDLADAGIFYLYTKWDDVESYRRWHAGPGHNQSHAFIPHGLKLDAAFTRIEVLEEAGAEGAAREQFLLEFFRTSQNAFLVHLDRSGVIRGCTPGFLAELDLREEEVLGRELRQYLAAADSESFAQRLRAPQPGRSFILNLSGAAQTPVSVRARLLPGPAGALLVAECDRQEDMRLARQFLELNNEMAALTRQLQQRNQELDLARSHLARAVEERERSHWFIRRMQEVLPICMGCKRVRPGSDGSWETLADFLHKNTDFLSHGFCPECAEKWRRGEL